MRFHIKYLRRVKSFKNLKFSHTPFTRRQLPRCNDIINPTLPLIPTVFQSHGVTHDATRCCFFFFFFVLMNLTNVLPRLMLILDLLEKGKNEFSISQLLYILWQVATTPVQCFISRWNFFFRFVGELLGFLSEYFNLIFVTLVIIARLDMKNWLLRVRHVLNLWLNRPEPFSTGYIVQCGHVNY